MKIYFVRHGQSEANAKATHSGWGQYPLSDKGRVEAARVRDLLSEKCFDKVYCSDLIRAAETCRIALPNADAEETELLREVNVGKLSGKRFTECIEEYGEKYTEDKKAFEFSAYGGESYAEFISRVKSFLDKAKDSGYENIAAFCHGGFISAVIDVIVGGKTERASFICANCSISVFEYKDGKWRMLLWNYSGEI